MRTVMSLVLLAAISGSASASFTLTGNPVIDPGWTYQGRALDNGGYVRGTANYNFNIYTTEFNLNAGSNPLTNSGWNAGDRIVGMGGTFLNLSPTQLGWPAGTVFTGPAQNSQLAANTRVISKFGVPNPTNVFNPSSTAPNVNTGGLGSHSGGNGGIGSVQVSIASNRFTAANAGILLTPSNLTGGAVTTPDNVAQWMGTVGSNGLDLFDAGTNSFPSARYIYTVDPSGFLASWQVLLNISMVAQYPGSSPILPIGGGDWIQAVQTGGGAGSFTDGLITTDPFFPAPAPPAIYLALFGGASLLGLRRIRK